MALKGRHKYYYYANSEKIPLAEEKDLVAVDGAQVLKAGLKAKDWEQLRVKGKALLKGWWLIDGKGLPEAVIKKLKDQKGIQQVFKAGGALVIAYPEIELAVRSNAKVAVLKTWLKKNKDMVNVLENRGASWLIEAKSGDGVDALNLANTITEEFAPELSQSRFVRVVKTPKSNEV